MQAMSKFGPVTVVREEAVCAVDSYVLPATGTCGAEIAAFWPLQAAASRTRPETQENARR